MVFLGGAFIWHHFVYTNARKNVQKSVQFSTAHVQQMYKPTYKSKSLILRSIERDLNLTLTNRLEHGRDNGNIQGSDALRAQGRIHAGVYLGDSSDQARIYQD